MNKLLLSAACCFVFSAQTANATRETSGGGNPFANSCSDDGGRYVILDEPAGEDGFCQFGTVISGVWGQNAKNTLAYKALFNNLQSKADNSVMQFDPAKYCSILGGTLKFYTVPYSYQTASRFVGMCEFSDHSSMEVMALLSGAESPENGVLVQALQNSASSPHF